MLKLTDRKIRSLRPKGKGFKVFDEHGLYLFVTPTGSKSWRMKYRYDGKERGLTFGLYPLISLADARYRRDKVRLKIIDGIDPANEVREARRERVAKSSNTFLCLAREYLDGMQAEGRAAGTIRKAEFFLSKLDREIGHLPIDGITSAELFSPIAKLLERRQFETAKKTRAFASRIFRLAMATSRAKTDPAEPLRGALIAAPVKHHAAPIELALLERVLRDISRYPNAITRMALQLIAQTYVRPGSLRKAKWQEIDLEESAWSIPSENMKGRRPFRLPLSKKSVSIIKDLRPLSGHSEFLFPSTTSLRKPMSENTLNSALRRMGYTKDEVTAHGFRAVASTHLNESGLWSIDAIELSLSHSRRDQVRAAYHRGLHWDERVKMAEWWSDFLKSHGA